MNMRKTSMGLAVLTALLVGGAALYAWQGARLLQFGAPAPATQAQAAAKAPVPVTLASAEKSAFAVYQTGLGTVQAFNTVFVRTRVDGQIEKVAFEEGQMVKAGDLLVQIDARPYQAALDQTTAKKTADAANLKNAKADLERFINLGKYASRQQTDTQQASVNQNTAQIALDQAAIDNAQTQFDYTTIRAPISGLAGFRLVDVGNIVNAATQTGIVTIAQIEPISVIFTIPEEQLQDLNQSFKAGAMPVTAYSTDGSRQLSQGTLSVINNQVDAATGTVRLKATFENRDHALWPGLSVSTKMLVRTLPDAVTIPDDAVQHGPDGLFVYVVDATGKAQPQAVSVSQSAGGRSVVEKGLEAGRQIISKGQYRVQPGVIVADQRKAEDSRPSEKVD